MASSNVVREYINSCSSKVMKGADNRREFANKLCQLINFYDFKEMHAFIEEMRGLEFYRSEDRVLFCDLFFSWIREQGDESFNA